VVWDQIIGQPDPPTASCQSGRGRRALPERQEEPGGGMDRDGRWVLEAL